MRNLLLVFMLFSSSVFAEPVKDRELLYNLVKIHDGTPAMNDPINSCVAHAALFKIAAQYRDKGKKLFNKDNPYDSTLGRLQRNINREKDIDSGTVGLIAQSVYEEFKTTAPEDLYMQAYDSCINTPQ